MELIKKRKSIRTYNQQPVPPHHIKLLEKFIDIKKDNIFSGDVDLQIWTDSEQVVPTYGTIKGASCYIVGKTTNTIAGLLAYGYVMESVLLYALSLGVSSCWLGGTFKRNLFVKKLELHEPQIIPAIASLGYEKAQKHVGDKVIRAVAKSDKRKNEKELFFKDSFENPITKETAGKFADALEAVRWAPSASNKQPWRIVLREKTFDFYQDTSHLYKNVLSFDIQKVDMGIAMYHFENVIRETHSKGTWQKRDLPPIEGKEYLMSYCL